MSGDPLVVVTGASRGVGREAVLALVNVHAVNVLAVARDQAALDSLQRQCAGARANVETLVLDLAALDAVDNVQRQVGKRRVLGLLNNAGLLRKRGFGMWTLDDLQALFQVNASVPFLLVQALVERLSGDPPGHVVNIGSMGGVQGSVKFPGLAGYSASKMALAGFTECLAEELRDRQVRCNCLALGAVDTDMLRAAFPGYQAPVTAEAMGREVARFLIEGHNYFNGKVLPMSLSTP
ncbi:MAG: SDR family oxidoreductase [Flavobacteriales bacterium]|nr:SDR family oxidoreductase [Flavobacteriales bacterium]